MSPLPCERLLAALRKACVPAVAGGAVLGLLGCASVSQPPAPLPFDVPPAWSVAEASGTTTASSLAQWWLRFDDPLLASLEAQAMQANTSVQERRSRVARGPRPARRVGRRAVAVGQRFGHGPAQHRGRQEPRQQLQGGTRRELGARHLRRQSGCPRRKRSGGRGDAGQPSATSRCRSPPKSRSPTSRCAARRSTSRSRRTISRRSRRRCRSPSGACRRASPRRSTSSRRVRRPNRRARCFPRCGRTRSRRGTRSRC